MIAVVIRIIIQTQYSNLVLDEWTTYTKKSDVDYRYKYNEDGLIQFLIGPFLDDELVFAFDLGRRYYSSIIFECKKNQIITRDLGLRFGYGKRPKPNSQDSQLINHNNFLFTKMYRAWPLGLSLYQINDSLDSYDEIYNANIRTNPMFVKTRISKEFPFHEFENIHAIYDEKLHAVLELFEAGEVLINKEISTIINWSILESFASRKLKDELSLQLLDELIDVIECSHSLKKVKDATKGFINSGKYESSRQTVRDVVKTFCSFRKINNIDVLDVTDEAYQVRSGFTHGRMFPSDEKTYLFSHIVSDVIDNYYQGIQNVKQELRVNA